MASNLRVDTILPSTGTTLGIGTASGTINFLGNSNIVTSGTLTAASASITGNLGVGGVLTYEDVTNIDSVGVITARTGINVTSGNIALSSNGANVAITTAFDFKIRSNTAKFGIHIDNASGTPTLEFGIGGAQGADITTNSTGPIVLKPNNSERLRITHNGEIGIGGANYGTSGQVLTSQGSGSAVQWSSPSSGLAMADQWRLTTGQTITTQDVILTAWERPDTSGTGGGAYVGGGMSNSSGTFSFPTTGIYLITFEACFNGTNNTRYSEIDIVVTKNNSSYVEVSRSFLYFNRPTGTSTGDSASCSFIMDVDNISNDKVRFESSQDNVGQHQVLGDSGINMTVATFLRLGDT